MRIKERVTDHYYYKGTPLWRLAHQAGLKSASYFWVGSELTPSGWHPDYYYPYEESVPFEDRVDKVIEWLTLPENERPHFITLYFSSPDHEADTYGPVSDEAKQAVLRADALLGKLMSGINNLNLPVNVIVVSDHGLTEMVATNNTYIFLDELFELGNPSLRFANGGTQAHLYLNSPQHIDSMYSLLKKNEKFFHVLKRSEFPEHWHYNNERSGDLLIVAEPGHYIMQRDRAKFMTGIVEGKKFGAHGYDPYKVKDVQGIFYAQGPNIKKGGVVPSFENIHIYPLVAKILHIGTPFIDGDFSVLEKIYKSKE
jgi:alkaline phosphatase D